jgi:DNA-binding SARP family transcriptional activator
MLRTSSALTGEISVAPLRQVSKAKKTLTALAPLQVRCLGSFEVSLGWDKLDSWRSNKAKLLLKYLIAQRGRPVPKDVLMETLWPECDPLAGNNNLKAAVHALRQTLNLNGKDANDQGVAFYVLFLEGSYMINPQAELWVDVDEFERHCAVGRRLEKEGQIDEAMRAYELAEGLYRGDYLEDDPYEEWALLRREALKDVYLSILGKLGEHSVRREDYEVGILYWQKILSKDPCREDAYRGLIRCHSRLGQRSRALHWYNLCARTTKTELNTLPDQQTEALRDRLLRGEYI